MKRVVFALLIIFFTSCESQREIAEKRTSAMNSWIGSTKQNIIMQMGLPLKTGSDGSTGEVLVYGQQFQFHRYDGTPYVMWAYKMFYINSQNKCYHWLTQNLQVPPTQLDISLFIR